MRCEKISSIPKFINDSVTHNMAPVTTENLQTGAKEMLYNILHIIKEDYKYTLLFDSS